MGYEREYIDTNLSIDGRNIPYPVFTAYGYLKYKLEMNEQDLEEWLEENYETFTLLNQIIALKQSCFLLRHTSHSCGSLSECLYKLKNSLIVEIKEKYDFTFDDAWMEQLVE